MKPQRILPALLACLLLLSAAAARAETWAEKNLTPIQQQWLREHPVLRLGVGTRFVPIMWVERQGGKYHFKGVVSDYVALLQKRLGVRMDVVFGITFKQALALGRQGRIDLFPCVAPTPAREDFLLLTKPYLSFPLVIITRRDYPYISGLSDLDGARVAVVKTLATYARLRRDYPELKLYPVASIPKGLEAVSLGRADAYIINLAVADHYMQRLGLTNLRVAAPTSYQYNRLSMGVRKDWPVLAGILNQALASVGPKTRSKFLQHWVKVEHEMGVPHGEIIKWSLIAGGIALMFFVLFWFWNRRLQREVQSRKLAEKTLVNEKLITENLLESLPGVFYLFDRQGKLLRWNRNFELLSGLSAEEIAVKGPLDFIAPEDRQRVEQRIAEVYDKGYAAVEADLISKAGDRVPHLFSGQLVYIDQQPCLVGMGIDISQRKAMEQAQRESKEQFRALSEQSPLGIALIDRQGRYQYLNPAFVKMFGYTLADIPTGNEWFRLAYPDPDYRQAVREAWLEDLRSIPSGEARPRSYRVRCKDGGEKTVLFRPVTIGQGRQFVLCEDIGERLAAENSLRESERRYRQLFNSISDLICTHDLQGRLLTVNRTASLALGYRPEEIIGRHIADFMADEFRQDFERDYLPGIRARGYMSGVAKYVTQKGEVRYLEYRNQLISEPDKEPYVIGSARDVTERIQAEHKLNKLQEQLFQAQKMEALGVLASGVAHDFNNVLQVISGFTQLILSESEQLPRDRERLLNIQRSIERAAVMIKSLLALSRRSGAHKEQMELNHEIERTLKVLEHVLPRMIDIRTDLARDLRPILGDPGQIEQALLNLGTNAGHAMPQGGELCFATANVTLDKEDCAGMHGLSPGEYVRLTVQDSGLGMDQETLSHIFEPFFTTKSPERGTGLGLSMVYGVVSGHGGHISCRSRPGGGTLFSIHFPADQGPAPAAVQREPVPQAHLVGRERVLVVDDEEAILQTCRQALEGFGYQVLTATSGEDALAVWQNDPEAVDLVVLDLNMPGMGGLKCLEAMTEQRPRTKVLVATGFADEGLLKDLRSRGRHLLIRKPYSFTELLQTVRRLLDQ